MTRELRSEANKSKFKEVLPTNLSISNKSKTINKRRKKAVEAKNANNEQNNKWNINSILSNIFAYTEFKDLVNFNTVCKRWNHLTNPIIHKSVKLQRRRAIQNKVHDKRLNKSAKADAEVGMCISDNAKYAPFIKQFKYTENMEPQRAIEFFKTFEFIANLTLDGVSMSQDQFIAIIIALTQLQGLNLINFSVKRIIRHKFIIEAVQLPLTLKKLALESLNLYKNPELFIKTINSHSKLVEFSYATYGQSNFLEPFYKNYSSLKTFEYSNSNHANLQHLTNIFELNPQLIALKLTLSCWNNDLIRNVSDILTNLEEFRINTYSCNPSQDILITQKLRIPTKIKKLNINCGLLSQPSFNSILLKCPLLKELDIVLPGVWYEWIKEIGSKCMNIEKLAISPPKHVYCMALIQFYKIYMK